MLSGHYQQYQTAKMVNKMKELIWYEKYRATSLDGLILPKNVRKNMKGYIKEKEIPHLLFHGPAGSGKTTLALILIKACASAKLILNGSSEDRGIGTIKKKVKQFASSKRISKGKLNIVFIDEADGLTPEAQDALKNIIETYQSNCRFIFTANEIDQITDPIYSRCTMFAFESMPNDYFLNFLYDILDDEKIGYKKNDIEILVNTSICSYPCSTIPVDSHDLHSCDIKTLLFVENPVSIQL